jgi:hypothetical protein
MSDDPSSPMTHPEELLAAYVGGSLEPSQRDEVEAHLASCGSCRQDVEFARGARAALLALPELEAPGLAEKGLAALGVEAKAPDDLAERRRGRDWGERWGRVAWSAGLAAAAVIAVVFLFTGGLFGGRDQAESPTAAESGFGAAADGPLQIVQGGDRDPEELDALARTLAASSAGRAALVASPRPVGPPADDVREPSGPIEEITACVRQGAALGPEIAPTYLEESTFEGIPIYVGAFIVAPVSGGRAHLELVAVTRDACQPVYFARRNL